MQLKSRFFALPLAVVLASGALFSAAPAQAAPKSKTYKTGAVALGVLGAYLLSKGKTVEGAAAIGGGVLAYKQGEKERKNERYGSNYGNDRYGRYDNSGDYSNGISDNGNYNNGSYNNDRNNDRWNSGWHNGSNSNSDYSYNGNAYVTPTDENDRGCRDQEDNGQGRKRGRNGQGRAQNRSWNR